MLKIEVQLSDAFTQALQQIDNGDAEPIRRGFKQAATRYLGWIRQRFVSASDGDGTWPELAISTIIARLRKSAKGRKRLKKAQQLSAQARGIVQAGFGLGEALRGGQHVPILRDTGLLFNSLTEFAQGHVEEELPNAIEVGTMIKYARYHQDGGPNLPQRKILVEPSAPIMALMEGYIQNGYNRALRNAFGVQA